MKKAGILDYLTNLKVLFCILLAVTLLFAFQQINLGIGRLGNVAIFKMSFYNLINHRDMFSAGHVYEDIKLDAYKYSPAFALIYAPLAILPLSLSTILWDVFNSVLLFFAIRSLPFDNKKKSLIIWLILLELIISVQNSQSNPLMAALLIFAFTAMENKNILLATLCIVLSIYIKLFGAVALVLFLFYPGKLKFILYTAMWGIILFLLPLLVISFSELLAIYKSWALALKDDESSSWGLSLMGIIKTWFGVNISKTIIQLAGLILLCIPLISTKAYQNLQFRLLYLCSILIWVVTFNHKAESPSFIIAVTGIAIWFVMQKPNPITIILLVFAIAVTSLAHSDLVPMSFRTNYIDAFMIKGLPSFVMWVVIQYSIYLIAFKAPPLQAQGSIDG